MFPVTEWTLILTARDQGLSSAMPAMERLAMAYWRPLYSFLRCRGLNHNDASDGVQGFFDHLLQREFLQHLRPREGKFRTFLLRSLANWLNDQHDRATAKKRGGGIPGGLAEWDALDLEAQASLAPVAGDSPETAFDRCWAQAIVDRAFVRVRAGYETRGRTDLIECLQILILDEPTPGTYARCAAALGMSEGAVRKAVFDLRAKFAGFVREEILRTVGSETAAQEELRYLITLLRQ